MYEIYLKVLLNNRLFNSLTNIIVDKAITTKHIRTLFLIGKVKENISIPGKSIKRIGSYQASIRLHREVSAQLNFELQPEKK